MPLIKEDLNSVKARIADFVTDARAWSYTEITEGVVSPKYRAETGTAVYFVKVIPDNERYTLQLIHGMDMPIVPRIVYPELLDDNVLVCEFVAGRHPQQRKLDPELMREYADFQNTLNDRRYFGASSIPSGCRFNDRDDGFAVTTFKRNFNDGFERLEGIRHFDLPVVEEFVGIARCIEHDLDDLARTFAEMPFAWQHNDFKENNIIDTGTRQYLVDWGSSYGHWPFLNDLSIFIVNDQTACDAYLERTTVDIPSENRFREWLTAALAARFAALIKFRLDPREGFVKDRDRLEAFLGYEKETYGALWK